MQLQRTTKHTPRARLAPKWRVMDARGQRLGRLAAEAARVLQGKHRAIYSPHELTGDFVVVVNAASVDVTGNKRAQKVYYRHTGYVGHLRQRTLDEMMTRFPERVIQAAVKGMLPRNRLGRRMLKRLKVYPGAEHPHEAQVNAGTGARAAARAAAERRRAEAPTAPPSPAVEEPQAEPAPEIAAEQAEEQPQPAAAPRRRRRAQAADVEEPQAESAPETVAEQPDEQPQAKSAPETVAEQTDEQPQAESAPEAVAEQTNEQPQTKSAPPRRRRAPARKAAPKKDEE